MNLQRLFKIQAELDNAIIEKKGLHGQDLLADRILALQVELGECANEWRGFKFWSEDQSPRTRKTVNCHACKGLGEFHAQVFSGTHHVDDVSEPCSYCEGTGLQEDTNPLLVEYVDCLHFVLSIGLCLGIEKYEVIPGKVDNEINQFIELNYQSYRIIQKHGWSKEPVKREWAILADYFFGLGEMLDFSWEEIEQAYLDKNKINHERQVTGY